MHCVVKIFLLTHDALAFTALYTMHRMDSTNSARTRVTTCMIQGKCHAIWQCLLLPVIAAVTCEILGMNMTITFFSPSVKQAHNSWRFTKHLICSTLIPAGSNHTCEHSFTGVFFYTDRFKDGKVTEKTVAVSQAKRFTKTGIGRRQAITASLKRTM